MSESKKPYFTIPDEPWAHGWESGIPTAQLLLMEDAMIEKIKPKSMTLLLKVFYDLQGESLESMELNLHQVVDKAYGNSEFTQDSEAECVGYRYTIVPVMKVFVARYETPFTEEVRVFSDSDLVEIWKDEIALRNWKTKFTDSPPPHGVGAGIEYFLRLKDERIVINEYEVLDE